MGIVKKEEPKRVIRKVTMTLFEDGHFHATFEGVTKRSEVITLLKQCDRYTARQFQLGRSLGEENSKIETLSS